MLPGGSLISLGLEVDLFELDATDWRAFWGLIDQIKATANTWRPPQPLDAPQDTAALSGEADAD
jgi:hypothetical protein